MDWDLDIDDEVAMVEGVSTLVAFHHFVATFFVFEVKQKDLVAESVLFRFEINMPAISAIAKINSCIVKYVLMHRSKMYRVMK